MNDITWEEAVEMYSDKLHPNDITTYNCPKCGKKNALALSYCPRHISYQCVFCGDWIPKLHFHEVIEEQYGIKILSFMDRLINHIEQVHAEYGGETSVFEPIGNMFICTNKITGEDNGLS